MIARLDRSPEETLVALESTASGPPPEEAERCAEALERLAGPAFLHDGERFRWANSSWQELSGFAREELVGKPVSILIPGWRWNADASPGVREWYLERRDGELYRLRLEERFLEDCRLSECVVTVASDRKLPEAALPGGDRAELTLSSLDDCVLRTDADGRIEYLNPSAERLFGPAVDCLARPASSIVRLLDESSRERIVDPVGVAFAESRTVDTPDRAAVVLPDGREVAVRGSVSPLLDGFGRITGAVLVLRDVSATRALEREMSYLAQHDPLTGLDNRRELERHLQEALTSARNERREHALLYLDLDQFKLVNDTCGHMAGDEFLRQISELLRSRLRRSDHLARLGGDEFGFLLHDCSPESAIEIADEVRRLVRSFRFGWEGHIFEVGASIGVVPIHAASENLTDLLRAADTACYVVKDRGGNGVHSFSLDDTAIGLRQGEMLWVQRLHRAREDGTLRLHYQMIEPLSLEAGGAMCELFLRLADRDGTLHRAGSFIPAAERFGLMVDLDRWVIRTAFAAIAEATRNRRDPGTGFAAPAPVDCFAINLSAHSLSSRTFLEFVLEELESSGIFPESVCFEITETAAISHLDRAKQLISSLREIGCRFALDDFGRGLSSFAYLRDLKVDLLKIDGDFIRALPTDTVNRAMVASIHQIGQVMGLKTIAEGVEDGATLEVLRELGVDYAQGNFLHRPQPVIHDR